MKGLTADDRHAQKANRQNYSEPLSRLLCSCVFSLSPTCRLAGGLSEVSGPGITHHDHSCQHQVVPLIIGLLQNRLGVSSLSPHHQVHLLWLCSAPFPADALRACAVKQVLYFLRKVIITIKFDFYRTE